MQYLFRMYGNEIQVIRYMTTHTEIEYIYNEETHMREPHEYEAKYYFTTLEQAQKDGEPIKLDYEPFEWLDGILTKDTENTYAEAIKIYEMGEEAYKKSLLQENAQTNEQLYSDVSQCILSMIS